jgi:hypothetical protein
MLGEMAAFAWTVGLLARLKRQNGDGAKQFALLLLNATLAASCPSL